jgi:tetratricopeptide (TPR) repeat protein
MILRPTFGKPATTHPTRQAVVAQYRNPERAFSLYLEASQLDEHESTLHQAERLYRHAIALHPDFALAITNLGNVCFRLGREDEAVALYAQALDIDPKQPEAAYNIGHILLEDGDTDRAAPYFRQAVASDPKFVLAYFQLALCLEPEREAQEYWTKFLELQPFGKYADVARGHLR